MEYTKIGILISGVVVLSSHLLLTNTKTYKIYFSGLDTQSLQYNVKIHAQLCYDRLKDFSRFKLWIAFSNTVSSGNEKIK